MLSLLRIDAVRERLAAQIPDLAGSLGTAGEFAQLVERKQLPPWRLGAFVLPGRLSGGAAQAISGAFVQAMVETIAVVLVVRVQADPTGAKAVDELTPHVRSVVAAICGWAPDDTPGVFVLDGGELVGSQGGALIFQLDFSLNDQLRILS